MRFTSPTPLAMVLQRAHADCVSGFVARDEQRDRRLGHLLDGELELELARRQRDEIGIEIRDQRADIILQRRFLSRS